MKEIERSDKQLGRFYQDQNLDDQDIKIKFYLNSKKAPLIGIKGVVFYMFRRTELMSHISDITKKMSKKRERELLLTKDAIKDQFSNIDVKNISWS